MSADETQGSAGGADARPRIPPARLRAAGRRAHRGAAARRLRGRTEPHHAHRHDRPGGRVAAEHRRARSAGRGARRTGGAPRRARPRAGARRDRRRAGAAGDPRAPRVPQELGPLRDALSRLQMAYARELRPAAPAAADAGARRPARRAAPRSRRQPSSRGRASDRRAPGRRSPAAGSGCPGVERPQRPPASPAALRARHDRLRRAFAPGRRSGLSDRPSNVRAIHPRAARKSDRGGFLLSSFLTNHGVVVALVCAACAVVYGLVTTRSLLALSPGNERMQSISLAVQQGARAYLNRQYTTIAVVGVVLFVALIFIQNIAVACGFAIGGILSGSTGYIGMNVSVRSNARVAEAARGGVSPALQVAFRGGAITGPARRRARAARRRRLLRRAHLDLQRQPEDGGRRAHRPRLRRLADLGLRAARRRHLHEGRRRRRRPRRQGRGGDPRGRPAQPGDDRRQRRRQRRRLRRHGRRPVRDLRGDRDRRDAARRADLPRVHARRALPAGDRRRGDHRLDHRHVRRAHENGQRRARAAAGPDRLRRDRGGGVRADHLLADAQPHLQGRRQHRQHAELGPPLPVLADRHRRHGAAVRTDRILHLDALLAGQEDGESVDHRATRRTSSRASPRACRRPRCRRS